MNQYAEYGLGPRAVTFAVPNAAQFDGQYMQGVPKKWDAKLFWQ